MTIEDKPEPLAHKLIRESKELIFSNTRSAYVIGVTALEVSVKQFVSFKSPSTKWLLKEMQSPNIYKIMSEYFPEIEPKFILQKLNYDKITTINAIRNGL